MLHQGKGYCSDVLAEGHDKVPSLRAKGISDAMCATSNLEKDEYVVRSC